MRKLLLPILGLLLWAMPASSQALINHAGKICAATSCTTTAGSFSGSNLLVVLVSEKATGGETITVNESSSNSWTQLSVFSGGSNSAVLSYVLNPTVTASQTFTCATSGGGGFAFVSCAVEGFSVANGGFDTSTGADTGTGNCTASSACQPGSITPAVPNEIFITGSGNNGGSGTVSIGSSFIISNSDATGTDENYAMAYLISSGSSAQNPAWNWNNTSATNATMAAFKPGVASVGGSKVVGPSKSVGPSKVNYWQPIWRRREELQ